MPPTSGGPGFPIINLTNCAPDNSNPARKPWIPITLSGPVCEDWLVYHTNQTGNWEVFRLGNIPGKGQTNNNLTRGGKDTYNVGPALSPDRRSMAFYTNRDGNWEIYVVATDGLSAPQRVTYKSTAVDADPVWSPDGKQIVYESTRTGNLDLYLFDVTNGDERQITNGPASDMNPYWAPDGKSLMYESVIEGQSQIYSVELATLKTTKISDGKGNDYNPTYSPDGKQIAFRSDRDGSTRVLYVMNANGSNLKAISAPNGNTNNQSWSPDGSLISYQSDLGGNTNIYVYALATGKTRVVTDDSMKMIGYAPTWQCQTTTLIFTSNVKGDANVYSTQALPIDAKPIKVDKDASELTSDKADDQFAENSPIEEDASLNFAGVTIKK